jgi:hypothetical protein
MNTRLESVPRDGQLVIVEDDGGQNAVARWSHQFEAWFGPDGEPLTIHPLRWRPQSPAESAQRLANGPATSAAGVFGQSLKSEAPDERGALERLSDKVFGPEGEPMAIPPLSWQPQSLDDSPPLNRAPPALAMGAPGESKLDDAAADERAAANANRGTLDRLSDNLDREPTVPPWATQLRDDSSIRPSKAAVSPFGVIEQSMPTNHVPSDWPVLEKNVSLREERDGPEEEVADFPVVTPSAMSSGEAKRHRSFASTLLRIGIVSSIALAATILSSSHIQDQFQATFALLPRLDATAVTKEPADAHQVAERQEAVDARPSADQDPLPQQLIDKVAEQPATKAEEVPERTSSVADTALELSGTSWKKYIGPHGTRVDVPTSIFANDAGPAERGTGNRFSSGNASAQLEIYSLPNQARENPTSYLRNHVNVLSEKLLYRRVTSRSYVLASVKDGVISHSRCNFSRRIHCINLTYPERENGAWDPIANRISTSLRASR